MPKLRANVESMAAYVPGEQPPAGAKVIKLNTNENPYPPSPRVAEAVRAELGDDGERLRLYSDPKALALRQAAADVFGFPVEQILHGNGSDELLAMLFRAFVAEGERVAYPYPTYVLYETLAHAQAAQIFSVDFDRDFKLPKELFGTDARLTLLAAPNSPSGTVYSTEHIRTLASSLKNGVLVIDEAYAEFADANHLALAKELDNVVVLRTFSKSHSLAGMRLGLLFASARIVEGLWKVKDSYNLDRLAIVAGAAALRDAAWTARNVQCVRATRARLDDGLKALGIATIASQSNFIFARLKTAQSAAGAYQFLKARGILIRYFPARLLDDGLRITVGADAEIEALLAALKEYLSS
ncbi:MAG TPA: histidinol-phosphate transaminase [Planctomycetota bacterium]|nr:histidinol-phosphate transaminase [Planctomycetota bacterium]